MSAPSTPSIVRTIVPIGVGQLVAYLVTLGVTIPENVETAMTVLLGFVVTSLYYLAVRFIEQKFPKLGVLLGWAAVPAGYVPAKDRDVVRSEVVEVDDTPPPDGYEPRH